MKRHKLSYERRQGFVGLVFLAPWAVGLAIFTAYPMLYSLWLSVCTASFNVEGGIDTVFVGFQWYVEAFRADINFTPALISTATFIGYLAPMILVASVIFAVLLNKALPGRGFFRALFFLPVVFINGPVMSKLIGNSATAVIKPTEYAVYRILETLPDVISQPLLYIFDNVVMILWFSGIQILLVLSSLQKVSDSLYEAASIDGASRWQVFWKISLPSLRPMLLVTSVYTIVDLSNYSGNSISGYIQQNITRVGKEYVYSSALSWIYAIVVLLFMAVAYIIFRERRKDR